MSIKQVRHITCQESAHCMFSRVLFFVRASYGLRKIWVNASGLRFTYRRSCVKPAWWWEWLPVRNSAQGNKLQCREITMQTSNFSGQHFSTDAVLVPNEKLFFFSTKKKSSVSGLKTVSFCHGKNELLKLLSYIQLELLIWAREVILHSRSRWWYSWEHCC